MADNKFLDDLKSLSSAASSPNASAMMNLARERGNNIAASNSILIDRQNLSPLDFQRKYGIPVTQTVDQLDLSAAGLRGIMGTDRTDVQQLGDITSNIGIGAINSLGGAVTLGARLFGPDAARAVAQTVKKDVEYFQGNQSEGMQDQRRLGGMAAELDKQDNSEQYKKDAAKDGNLVAELRSFGRSASDAAARLYENPTMLEAGLSEGIGSIAAAAPTGGAINAFGQVGRQVLNKAMGVAAPVKSLLPAAIDKIGSIPLAIGAMEGGNSYAGSVNEVMDMSFEDLEKNSPTFRSLVNSGISKEEARQMVADNTGLQAASIQGPLAAVTGKLVAGFEGAPLASNGIRHALTNVASEGVEEGIQSFTGGAAQNYAIQQNADETRRVGEDLGAATAEGAILGLASAGAMQAPGAGFNLAAKGVLRGGAVATDYLNNRSDKVTAQIDAASPVSVENVTADVATANEVAPTVTQGLRELAATAPEDQKAVADAYIQRVENAPVISATELKTLSKTQLQQIAQDNNGQLPDRLGTIVSMARVATNQDQPQSERASAAMFIMDQMREIESLYRDLPEFLQDTKQDDPRFAALDQYATAFSKIASIPAVVEAMKAATNQDLITEDTIGDNAANVVAAQADHVPENVDPVLAGKVLLQNDKGDVTLSPIEVAKIKAAIALNRAGTEYAKETGEELQREAPNGNLLNPRPSQIVSRQIEVDGGDKDWQLSMAGHIRAINNAMSVGTPEQQMQRMTALNMFAQSMANKVAAFNESAANNGQKVKYVSAGSNNRWLPANKQYTAALHLNNKNSVEFAQTVASEAKALAMLANNMAEIYPDFKMPKIEVPSLVLEQKAAPVEQEARQERSDQTKVETPVEKQEATVEAPVAKEPDTSEADAQEAIKNELAELPGKAERRQAEREAQVIADEKIEQEGKKERRAAEREARNERDQEVDETVEDTTLTRYPKLMNIGDGEGQNQFHLAYKVPKTEKSRLNRLMNPINELRDLLKSPFMMVEFMDKKDINYSIPDESLEKLDDIMSFGSEIIRAMNARFTTKEGKKLLAAVVAGKPANRWREGRNLNIVERNGEGFRYNKQLVQGAVIAGINQALNGEKQKVKVTAQDVAEFTGIPLDQVDATMVDAFNRGQSVAEFKRALADKIVEYWGVDKNRNADDTQVIGIAESVAAEVMHGLNAVGLISTEQPIEITYTLGNEDKFFTQQRVHFDMRDEGLVEDINALGAGSRLLDSLLLVEPSKALGAHIGQPSGNVPEFQLRSKVKNAPQQREALAAAAATPYYPNKDMHSFMEKFGWENFQKFMGGYAYKEGELHPMHERSLEGLNRTLKFSYDNVMNHMKEVRGYADKAGVDVSEMPTYYDFNMSKVGRMQMQGNNTPQSDKLAREIFMPTRSVLDMTNDVARAQFWMTVAQGLGIKTEKVSRADAVRQAQELASGKYASIIQDMVDWLGKRGDLGPDLADRIIAAMGSDASMHGLHSLLSVAKLTKAERDGSDLKAFEHFNYLEADGKTNGPIMTVALFASRMTADVIKVLRKGGIFLGEQSRTLNDHIQSRDGVDLYESTTISTSDYQTAFREAHRNNPKVIERLNTLTRVMAALDANIETDEQGVTLKLKRGVTKNPLTISIYGSGIDGIAAKVANGLLDAVYEKMSQGKLDDMTYNGFSNDIGQLLTETLSMKDGEIIFQAAKGSDKSEPKVMSPKQFNALKSHVRMLFVNQMHNGIKEQILNHVNPSTEALQKATQFQSIFQAAAQRTGWIDKMLAKRKNPEFRQGDWLSQKEQDEVFADTAKFAPIIETGTQNFYIAGSERSDLMPTVKFTNGVTVRAPETYGEAMDGSFGSPAYMFGAAPAGVKGVPSLVIGTGDGMIMQNALAKLGIKNALPVFDGINFAADKMDEGSRKVNEAVWMAMQANPMRAVAESFNKFLANDPVGTMLEDDNIEDVRNWLINEVSKTVAGKFNIKPEEILTPEQIREQLVILAEDLNTLALEIDARNIVMNELSISVDQMASAESPFSKEGNLPVSMDADEMADIFNDRFEQVLEDLKNDAKVRPAVEQSNNEVMTSLMDTTTPDENGARIATIPSLRIWLDNAAKDMNTDQKALMSSALESLKNSGYRIVFGTRDQINQYEGLNYPEYMTPVDYLGKVVPETRHIYITNVTGETILHELVHAATLDKVIGYYDNPVALTDSDRDAVHRIEGLMNEWLVQSQEADSEQLNSARASATNQIAGYLSTSQKALAVNEFMAWTLSNQELIKGAKKVAVKNPLFRIVGEALAAVKALLWGSRAPQVNEDIYTNLRFNTRILMKTPTPTELLRKDVRRAAMFQSTSFGSNQRLTDLRKRFVDKVSEYLNDPTEINTRGRDIDVAIAESSAQNVLATRIAAAFTMDAQSVSTFETIHTALSINTKLDPNALSRAQDMYSHVIKNLKVEDLMDDPLSTHPADRYNAQRKFDVITGAYAPKIDQLGRSDRLSSFLALAMVDEQFRSALQKMELPKSQKNTDGTLDAYFDNLGNSLLDKTASLLSGEGSSKNVREALDLLSLKMAEVSANDNVFGEQTYANGVDKIDTFIKNNVNKLGEKITNVSQVVIDKNVNPTMTKIAIFSRGIGEFINETTAAKSVDGLTAWLNTTDGLVTLRELVAEIVGRPTEGSVFDMITLVRSAVQQTRQQFREKLPQQLASKFKRQLSKDERTALFRGLGKTDAAVLFDRFGVRGTLDLIKDPSRLQAQIQTLESSVSSMAPTRAARLIKKSKQLANYMNTGEHGTNLLRNAYAIAHLFGEVGRARQADPELVKQIDALVSMYALERIENHHKTMLADLIDNETDGMEYLLSYLVGTRKDEVNNITSDISRVNNYKGYVPSLNQTGASLMVASDLRQTELVKLGYARIADYKGSSADRTAGSKGYYYAPSSGRATYNQGVLQTVHQTVNGIQPNTGYSNEGTAGRITDPVKVTQINRLVQNQRQTTEPLLPVYDSNGRVVAYERSMDPGIMGALGRSTDLLDMTGVWRGRQIEEKLAQVYNEKLIDNLYNIWDKAKTDKETNQFVDLSSSTDPIHADSWRLIPDDVRQQIKAKFGRDGFPIRRDMINDAVGFRSASIGDMWTGDTRVSDEKSKLVVDIATSIFEKDAYQKLVGWEKSLQNIVTEMKVLIVVKSVIVPVTNAIANVYQLMLRGVPLRHIGVGMAKKSAETTDYIRRRGKEIELDADLKAAIGRNDSVAIRKISNQIESIKDSYKRMSIWPLIEAGEFTAITEGGVSNDDLKLSNLIDKATSYLPDGLKTPYRYAMLTKDTSLFQGLALAVQYSDFLAKAVLYDDLTKRKKVSKAEALQAINEEFINYNRYAGRVRNYAESSGLIWFWNFKLRSMKIAASMIRNNPARALMSTFLPGVSSIGDPISDNMISVIGKGRLFNSVGPWMGMRAPSLNPWFNIIN